MFRLPSCTSPIFSWTPWARLSDCSAPNTSRSYSLIVAPAWRLGMTASFAIASSLCSLDRAGALVVSSSFGFGCCTDFGSFDDAIVLLFSLSCIIRTLQSPCEHARMPMMAPPPPSDFIARPTEFEALKSLLVDQAERQRVSTTAALKGARLLVRCSAFPFGCEHSSTHFAQHSLAVLWFHLFYQRHELLLGWS